MNTLPPVPPESDWFPVRITSIPVAGQNVFQEVWLNTSGVNADRIGGRTNTANDPAYAIDGSTFAVTAAGSAVQCFARRGPGAGGVKWELKGFSGSIAGEQAFTTILGSALTPDGTLFNAVSVSLSAGTYLLLPTLAVAVEGTSSALGAVLGDVYDATNAVSLPNSTLAPFDTVSGGVISAANRAFNMTKAVFFTAAATTTVNLRVRKVNMTSATVTVGQTSLSWLKLS